MKTRLLILMVPLLLWSSSYAGESMQLDGGPLLGGMTSRTPHIDNQQARLSEGEPVRPRISTWKRIAVPLLNTSLAMVSLGLAIQGTIWTKDNVHTIHTTEGAMHCFVMSTGSFGNWPHWSLWGWGSFSLLAPAAAVNWYDFWSGN